MFLGAAAGEGNLRPPGPDRDPIL